jgi:hypothetical protein
MVVNALGEGNVTKDRIVALADGLWPTHGTRILPGQGVTPNQQVTMFELINHLGNMGFSEFGEPLSAYAARGTTQDLRDFLEDPNTAVIVTIQWHQGDLTSGHAMVLAAYDPAHQEDDGDTIPYPWGFLNPAKPDSGLEWFTTADFQKMWGYWGTQDTPFGMIDIGGSNMVVVNR